MTGAESYDLVVVGARCAGSPLAALLARAGLRVAVVQQPRFRATCFPRTAVTRKHSRSLIDWG
jgi:flavin-dependent dehydrogenase